MFILCVLKQTKFINCLVDFSKIRASIQMLFKKHSWAWFLGGMISALQTSPNQLTENKFLKQKTIIV